MESRENFVISGLSGRFPESENSEIFWQHLIQGKDMVSENPRWDGELFGTPRRAGKIPLIEKFDANFFGVSGTQANTMDPKTRIALEVVYETLLDAGIHPKSLSGARVGVFMASSGSEAIDIWLRSTENRTGHYITGCHPCMLADRISYAFNFKGPSCVLDTGCSASFSAIQYAMLALKNGLCDSAIVGGANINTFPLVSNTFFNLQALSPDGKCKVFDASADGFVRSEAVVALYICRKVSAKRMYATILGAKCINDGYKEDGISVPSSETQVQLIKEMYAEAGVNPLDVTYVEAHGTGTKAGDPREIAALADAFCNGRREPLLVGSVKSNMGHAEIVSGLCGIAKVLLARRCGVIPPNIHFNTPNPECEALIEGRIQIVVKTTPFQGRFVGVNSFGIGGTTGHAILQFEDTISNLEVKCHTKTIQQLKSPSLENSSSTAIPMLIFASGRTQEAVEHLLDQATKSYENKDFIGLLQEIAKVHTAKHKFAGYAIIDLSSNIEVAVNARPATTQSMWYVYTGLGSQWVGMAKDMCKFKAFNNSVQLSAQLLRKADVDLTSTFLSEDMKCINRLENAFVAITACQIALTDLLESLEVYPDTMFGQSLGEVACGYTDGCLTRDQALLASFYRAKAFMESNIPSGTMAATALTWEQAQMRCPPDIFPAIHSSRNNVTISGPNQSIQKFVERLKKEDIFAKEVVSAQHAYHSPYVRSSEKRMLSTLKNVITEPKRRSGKWLSSSIPTNYWESELSKYCSAEYLVNNAMSTVNLYQVLQNVSNNSLVVEIGAHCFLQTILKQSLAVTVTVLGLMHRSYNNSKYFLTSIGKIFVAGFQVKCSTLYEPLKFPLPMETPQISPLIKWDHSLSWAVPLFKNERSVNQGFKFVISLSLDDEFLTGHVIEDKTVFPATGYIYLIWKAFAKLHSRCIDNIPVFFENINFKRMTTLQLNQNTEFIISVLTDSGNFEIFESSEIVCTGTIRKAYKVDLELFSNTVVETPVDNILEKEDFYKLLFLKGYDYQGLFRGVQYIDTNGLWAELAWKDNWISFLDTMLQSYILYLGSSLTERVVPIRLDSLTIFPATFKESLKNGSVIITHCRYTNVVECPGVRLCGLKPSVIPAITPLVQPTIMVQTFCANFKAETVESLGTTLEVFFGIVVDNCDMGTETFVFTEVTNCCQTVDVNLQSLVYFKFKFYEHRIVHSTDSKNCKSDCISETSEVFSSTSDLNTFSLSNLILTNQESEIPSCMNLIGDNGFLITTTPEISPDFALIAQRRTENTNMYLLRKIPNQQLKTMFVSADVPNFGWVNVLKETCLLAQPGHRIYIISRSATSGIIGFTHCIKKEWSNIRCVYINNAANMYSEVQIEDNILKNDLVFNVYVNKSWGTFANISFNKSEITKTTDLAYAEIKTVGDLSSLCWVESSRKLHDRTNYEIYFSSLNFKDIMFATGRIPKSAFAVRLQGHARYIGMEFSGKFRNKRVFGLSGGKCLATALDHKPKMVWDVPDHWSLAEAATVPVVYSTVLYAFFTRGRLTEGESVLIHSGSGGVGLAAITIALDINCTVYTTVGSNSKRAFLKEMFPQLQEKQILDNNNGKQFKEEILRQTKGKGVDVVLNSLAQDKLQASLHCLSRRGRFLEIGIFDSINNTSIGLAALLRNVDLQGIHMDDLLASDSHEVFHLQALMQDYLNKGKLKPLPFKCFSHDNLQEAFRYFSSRKHVGKVIIEVRGASGIATIPALPQTYFLPHKTYIIIGGLGGMGLEIVTWMIERGARKLFVVSRTGISTSYQKYKIQSWTKFGATIFLKNTDISSNSEVSKLLLEAISLGPLGGVFNLALQLQDAVFANQTSKTFEMVSNCKATATMIFDTLTRIYSPEMDYFVVFSSIVCGRGNAGQSNYGYANSSMERICEQRKLDGFTALAIQWGAVADVGSVGNVFRGTKVVEGTIGQTISSCITTLDLLLQQNETVVSSHQLLQGTQQFSRDSNLLSLSQKVANILGIPDSENIDVNVTLTELGMDSIMAAQIKHSIQQKKEDFIPLSGYGSLTFRDLKLLE